MKEFSVITCSVDDAKFANMEACYKQALAGEDFEIIRITDATSLCEGYIRGYYQSAGETIIFSHDDAAPMGLCASKIRSHLRRVDIVGGCGTNKLLGPVWLSAGPPYTFGQVLNRGAIPVLDANNQPVQSAEGQPQLQPGFILSVFGVPSALVEGIQAFDGFWFAARRSALGKDRAWFDPQTFDGFHLYDLDFSFSAYRRGLRLGIGCDLNLCHASTGGYNDPKWKPFAQRFADKWGAKLPKMPARIAQFTGLQLVDGQLALNIMNEFVEQTR